VLFPVKLENLGKLFRRLDYLPLLFCATEVVFPYRFDLVFMLNSFLALVFPPLYLFSFLLFLSLSLFSLPIFYIFACNEAVMSIANLL
jgi:hypothetical protein